MPTFDLSQPLVTGLQTYPGDPPVVLAPHADFDADGYRVTALELGSHSGTHLDAPSHTEPDGKRLGAFSLDTFRFDAQVADVRGVGARGEIARSHLPEPTDATLLVLRTGWDDHWGTARALDHPYLTRAAAEWCVEHDYHAATDGLSVDPTASPNAATEEPTGFGAHHMLLGNDRLILENLTGLDAVPTRFALHAYPLALDGDGSPVRAVGIA